ncbi:hypothetical protein [Vagococcus acidifermentans]|nr:hypothetical protein [Vagococcus acidifermentans]
MSFIEKIRQRHRDRQQRKKEALQKKNEKLRSEGKDPAAGWGKMVDTGGGGMNKAIISQGKGIVDLTGQNLENANYFSEEQKRLARELERKRLHDNQQKLEEDKSKKNR